MDMDIVKQGYNTTHLNSNIRILRKGMRISQEELANRIGLNRGNIASYENGTAEPKICNLLKLSHLFDVSIVYLTQVDLRNEETLRAAREASRKNPNFHTDESLQSYLQRANELEQVIDGLSTCCRYKLKMVGGEMSKEMQIVAMHFEELYDTAQALLNEHRSLLNHFGNGKK